CGGFTISPSFAPIFAREPSDATSITQAPFRFSTSLRPCRCIAVRHPCFDFATEGGKRIFNTNEKRPPKSTRDTAVRPLLCERQTTAIHRDATLRTSHNGRAPTRVRTSLRRGKPSFTRRNHVAKGAPMHYQHHVKPAPDVPKWSALLVEAVNKPGLIMEAYSAFHNYSIGNQILALVQCQLRGLEPGPINTFPGWQALGRTVKRGERALILCMPITRKVREAQESNDKTSEGDDERTFTSFMHKPRWFVISQTIGDEFTAPSLPAWDAAR